MRIAASRVPLIGGNPYLCIVRTDSEMEKRIRIVWALSLISMLLLVAGQGYWLWNQYQYKNEEYEEEIHRLVMDAVAVNDSIRREQPKKVFNKPNISFFNTNVDMHTDRDSLTNKLKERYTRTFVVGAMADKSVLSTAMKDSIVYKDKIVIHGEDKLLFNMSFSETIVACLSVADRCPFYVAALRFGAGD